MKAAPQKPIQSQDAATVPGWLRDPKSPRVDLQRPPLNDTARTSTVHEDSADDEPGYGHGV